MMTIMVRTLVMLVEILSQVWNQYAAFVNPIGDSILVYSNPDSVGRVIATKSWMLNDFASALFLAIAYLSFVFVGFMLKGKETPDSDQKMSVLQRFQKEPILIVQAVYNAIQVALCGWMMYEAAIQAYRNSFSLMCNTFDFSRTDIAVVLWVFYVSKVLDFMDTIFMIVRGKWRQVTFLHVYHHTSIFLIYWINANVAFDGDIYYTVILNAFVHFVMYGYYLLRTFNIHVPLVFKALVTNIQRIQFVCMLLQGSVLLIKECAFPTRITVGYLFYITSMLYLFTAFYNKAYSGKNEGKKSKKE